MPPADAGADADAAGAAAPSWPPPRDAARIDGILDRARLVRIPFDTAALAQLMFAQGGRIAGNALVAAHLLGDQRFARGFAPPAAGPGRDRRERERDAALASFTIVLDGPAPCLLGYTLHPLDRLAAVPLPADWTADPFDWARAETGPVRGRVSSGQPAAFVAAVAPILRQPVADKPLRQPPDGRKPRPRTRELDLVACAKAADPGFDLAEVCAGWFAATLARRLAGFGAPEAARLVPGTARVIGERRQAIPGRAGPRRPETGIATRCVRLNGLLEIADAEAFLAAIVGGVGRRRAYGLGFVAVQGG